jgi:hypothetical protein
MLLAACPATGPHLLVFDDEAVLTDEGVPIEAWGLSAPIPALAVGDGFGRLRRLVQAVSLAGTAVVRLTPLADGASASAGARERAVTPSGGAAQLVEVPAAEAGSRFQIEFRVVTRAGPLAFGAAQLAVVPRRENRA